MDFEIRRDRTKPQGRKKLTREREADSRLMQQGVRNREACRIVGIDERTGQKWRNGRHAYGNRKALPPITMVAAPSGPSRYLREEDRIHIADRLRENATVRAIAAELGRSPSTISREIRRNRHPGSGAYRPHAAQARADARTLVERATRYVMLLHLPGGHGAEAVLTALTATAQSLPVQLRRSLTWDQGSEMARHSELTLATDIPVYFCDPAGPWQRGSNKNTTACCGSTSRKAPTSRSTAPNTS